MNTALAPARAPLGIVAAGAAGAAALGVGAAQSPQLTVAVIAGAAFLYASFRDLSLGVAAFTLLIFFEEFAGSTGAAKGGGAVLAAAWALHLVTRPRETPFLLRDQPLLALGAIVLVALGFSSALWADDPARVVDAWVRLVQVVLLYFIAYSAVRGRRQLELLVWAFVIGATAAGLTGLVTGQSFAGTGRLSGGIADPNFLAASQVAGIALASFLLTAANARLFARVGAAAALLVCLVTLFQTQSRGGVLALLAVLAFAIAIAGPSRARIVVAALCVAGFAVVYFAAFATLDARERIVSDYTADDAAGRYDSWSIAWHMAGDNPATGVGLGNFPSEQLEYTAQAIPIQLVGQILETTTVVHNSYLETLAELGPLGLLAFAAAIAGPLVIAVRTLRAARAHDLSTHAMLRGLTAALAGVVVAYFFLSGEYEKQLWLLAALAAAAASVTRAALSAPDAGAPSSPRA